MRKYTEKEVYHLHHNGYVKQVHALPILVKESGKQKGPGYADPFETWCQDQNRLYKEIGEYSREELEQADEKEKTEVGIIRDLFGFPARNLCTHEIYTNYEKLSYEDDDIGLWSYYKRKSTRKKRPCLFYIHGGGWIAGSVFAVENQCRFIAQKADAVVFNLDYTLAPEAKFPKSLNSCYQAINHILEHAKEYGIDKEHVMLAGDSAGANLAAALTLKARDEGKKICSFQYLLYPGVCIGNAVNQLPEYKWNKDAYEIEQEQQEQILPQLSIGTGDSPIDALAADSYLNDAEEMYNPYASPVLAKDFKNLPDAVIATAEFDGLRLQGELYAEKLKAAGNQVEVIRYAGTFHAFFDRLGYVPQAEEVCLDIAERLNKKGR